MVKFLRNTLLGSLLLFATYGYAQDSTANKTIQDTAVNKAIDTSYKFPKAILVQLRSEHNRIAALAYARRYKEMEMVKEDAARINEKMIADFKDHVTFCPVYFYMDTNIDLIRKRKFAGLLFNADSTPVTTSVLDTSNDYLIVYYGYPTYQSRTTDSLTENKRNYNYQAGETPNRGTNNYLIEEYGYPAYGTKISDSGANKDDDGYGSKEPFGKGLIINNNRMQQVSFLYKFGYDNLFFRLNSANRGYVYVSKQFDMEYFPFAAKFNWKLDQMAKKMQKKKIRISHYPGIEMWELLLGKAVN